MWSVIDNIPEASLYFWYRWLTIFAIGLPILGAIMGGVFGWGAFIVSSRISDLQAVALKQAKNTATEARELARPRRLSPEEAAKMLIVARQLCSKIKRVLVTAANSNQEAQTYATDLVKIFKDAGCASDLQLPIPGVTPDVQGVRIRGKRFGQYPGGGRIDRRNFSRRGNSVSSESTHAGLFSERAIRADCWS